MGSTHPPVVLLPGGPVVQSRSSRASSSALPLVWGPRPGSGVFGPAAARLYLARSQHKDSRGEAPATGAARDPPALPMKRSGRPSPRAPVPAGVGSARREEPRPPTVPRLRLPRRPAARSAVNRGRASWPCSASCGEESFSCAPRLYLIKCMWLWRCVRGWQSVLL